MVGQAFTLRYIPAREDLNTIEVLQGPQIIRSAPRWNNVRRELSCVMDSRKDARQPPPAPY